MTNSVNTRELAIDIVIEVLENGGFSHKVLRQVLTKYQFLEKQERSFLTKVAEGTIENAIQIDYIINQISNTHTSKMKPLIRNLLRISVYQIKYMDSIPDSAVCNEAVKIAIKRGFGALKGFVNGVLRNIARQIDMIEYPDASEDLIKNMSVIYSMPEWLVEKFIYELGAEEAAKLMKAFLDHRKKLCVRCNTSKADIEEIIQMLEEEDVTVTKVKNYENALYIENIDYLEKLTAFNEGYIQVQDISSMLVACVAAPKQNDVCMDLCAAPGGKTLHLADILKGSGKIIARDISDYKVSMIEENISRIGYTNIETEVWDATVFDEDYEEKADIVIVDAPCSGLGVIAKKSDIKYKASKEGMKQLVEIQRDILKNAVRYVKKGGTLIYSTCTINKDENKNQVEWLEKNFDFTAEDLSPYLPKNMKDETIKKGYIQILPDNLGGDGFFIARFKKG